jgi:hypothetical protein
MLLLLLLQGEEMAIGVSGLFRRFGGTSPRVAVALFLLFGRILQQTTIDASFKALVLNGEFTFQELMKLIVQEIGRVLAGGKTRFLSDKYQHESHLFVASEMVAFVKILLRQSNTTKPLVGQVLHLILASSGGIELATSDLSELTGLFAILGKEITQLQEHGFVLSLSKSRGHEVTSVVMCDPLTRKLRCAGRGLATTKAEKDSFIPLARVSADSADFTLDVSEVPLLTKIQSFGVRNIETLTTLLNYTFTLPLPSCGVPGQAQQTSSISKISQLPGLPTFISMPILGVNSCLTTLLNYTFALPLPSCGVPGQAQPTSSISKIPQVPRSAWCEAKDK